MYGHMAKDAGEPGPGLISHPNSFFYPHVQAPQHADELLKVGLPPPARQYIKRPPGNPTSRKSPVLDFDTTFHSDSSILYVTHTTEWVYGLGVVDGDQAVHIPVRVTDLPDVVTGGYTRHPFLALHTPGKCGCHEWKKAWGQKSHHSSSCTFVNSAHHRRELGGGRAHCYVFVLHDAGQSSGG